MQGNSNFCYNEVHAFFYEQHFYKQRQVDISKNQAKAKQHPQAEFVLLGNYSLSSSTLLSKNNEIRWLMMMKTRLKMNQNHIGAT